MLTTKPSDGSIVLSHGSKVNSMLITAKSLRELNFGALMTVYEDGNRENGAEFWPDLEENQQILRAENDFYQYLQEVFFAQPDAVYCIWVSGGRYVSALRLEPYRDGMLLEALETAPQHRRKGYAEKLIRESTARLDGIKIYSHVGKKNIPSLKIHEKCGFQRILEHAVYVDGSVNQRSCTLLFQKEINQNR